MRRPILAAAVTLTFLMTIAAAPVLAGNSGETNLRFKITLTDIRADGTESSSAYELTTLDGTQSELLTGWRIPIPTHSFTTNKNGKKVPSSSFTYQNVGVTAQFEPTMAGGDRIRLRGNIEVSGIDNDPETLASPTAPKIGTFQHKFESLLSDGVPVTVARTPKPNGGALRVNIEATIEN